MGALSKIRGVIDRRILVNFRVDPEALTAVLPEPLQPKLVNGHGIGGICLIRLRGIRPVFLPPFIGISSENAAHRIAVVLPDGTEAVYIPRRDTSSLLNSLVGGRLFPGVHHRSEFVVAEDAGSFEISVTSAEGDSLLRVRAAKSDHLPTSSTFDDLEAASSFFEAGSLGYSPSVQPGRLDGLELCVDRWEVSPLRVEEVYSSYFQTGSRFTEGMVAFDCALLMEGIPHQWESQNPLYCSFHRRGAEVPGEIGSSA